MLVENTVNFKSKDEAQDSLYGLKQLPTFLFAYVHPKKNQTFDVVSVFDCRPGETKPGQRHIKALTFGDIDGGWMHDPTDDFQTA